MEIRRLKTDNEAFRDQTGPLEVASPLRQLALGQESPGRREGGGGGGGGGYESVDVGADMDWAGLHYGDGFPDSMDPHVEAGHLRQDMSRLRAELQQCRTQQKVYPGAIV